MMYPLALVGAVATFVLISDNEKIVTATSLHRTTRETSKYTSKYDNIDVDKILQSKRLLQSYVNCLLDKGPCTPEGRELKTYLPDALATDCSKCSEVQKKMAGKVFQHILLYHRDLFDQLVAKYDPDGHFRKHYQIDEDYDYSNLDDAK